MDIEELLDRAKEIASGIFEKEGEVVSQALGFAGNEVTILPLVWGNDKERQDRIVRAAAILQANRTDAYALMIEAWTSSNDNSRPSKSSDRREIVLVAVFDKCTSFASMADIIRHEDNTATLGDFIDTGDADGFGGQLASLLTMRIPKKVMKHTMKVISEMRHEQSLRTRLLNGLSDCGANVQPAHRRPMVVSPKTLPWFLRRKRAT